MRSNKIKVSVSCTVYNHEKFLRDALEGFVNQKTNFKYEVIIHDDASTDESKKIIQEYEQKYPHIIKPIYQKENQYSQNGVSIFQDYIYPKMSGEYIAYCEGDDYWIDDYKLQKQVDFLDNHPEYSACAHNYKKLFCQTGELKVMHECQDKDITLVDSFNGTMANYQTATLMHRYQYGDRNSELFDIYSSLADIPLTVYLALNGKFRFLGDVMSVYRYGSEGSWTQRNKLSENNKQFLLQYQDEHIAFFNCVKKHVSEEYQQILDNKILEAKFYKKILEGNVKELKKEPFREIYNKRSFKGKLVINFYPLYKIYQKLYWFNKK